jgi:hypothetical protein
MRPLLLVAALSATIGLFGCDTLYGIGADKMVANNPDDQCILGALRGTPGIREVAADTRINSGWLIAGDGPHHGSPIRYFRYDIGTDYFPTLMIEEHGDRGYRISDTMLSISKEIPYPVMEKAAPIMIAAEKQVSKDCNVPIDTGMHRYCHGSSCDGLDIANALP